MATCAAGDAETSTEVGEEKHVADEEKHVADEEMCVAGEEIHVAGGVIRAVVAAARHV